MLAEGETVYNFVTYSLVMLLMIENNVTETFSLTQICTVEQSMDV